MSVQDSESLVITTSPARSLNRRTCAGVAVAFMNSRSTVMRSCVVHVDVVTEPHGDLAFFGMLVDIAQLHRSRGFEPSHLPVRRELAQPLDTGIRVLGVRPESPPARLLDPCGHLRHRLLSPGLPRSAGKPRGCEPILGGQEKAKTFAGLATAGERPGADGRHDVLELDVPRLPWRLGFAVHSDDQFAEQVDLQYTAPTSPAVSAPSPATWPRSPAPPAGCRPRSPPGDAAGDTRRSTG